LKKKRKRKEETIGLDEYLKIKGLRDNQGEARMLLKGKAVIALFSAKGTLLMR
jgi:ribosome-associated protein YbcJ (S4-like RNA binding protein)